MTLLRKIIIRLRAQSEFYANFLWVQILMHNTFDNSITIIVKEVCASFSETRYQLVDCLANLVEEIKNLVLSSLIGDEFIDVSDNIHTNVASELISWKKRLE